MPGPPSRNHAKVRAHAESGLLSYGRNGPFMAVMGGKRSLVELTVSLSETPDQAPVDGCTNPEHDDANQSLLIDAISDFRIHWVHPAIAVHEHDHCRKEQPRGPKDDRLQSPPKPFHFLNITSSPSSAIARSSGSNGWKAVIRIECRRSFSGLAPISISWHVRHGGKPALSRRRSCAKYV